MCECASEVAILARRVNSLTATLDVYARDSKTVHPRLNDIEEAIKSLDRNVMSALDKVERVIQATEPLLDQAMPMIDKLKDSPIIKMLGA